MNCVIWGFVEVLETIVVKKAQFRKGRVRIWKSVSVVEMEVEKSKTKCLTNPPGDYIQCWSLDST